MPKPPRSDFASASVGLTLPAQHKNLGKLHDWLVDEVGISPDEQIIAHTNYQQGRFGRPPTHILLVTTQRVAYTHDPSPLRPRHQPHRSEGRDGQGRGHPSSCAAGSS